MNQTNQHELPLPMAGVEFRRQQIEQAVEKHRLLSMELEMTSACNLRCIYCYSAAGAACEGELSHEEILGAACQGIELGAQKIVLLGGGEPCCYSRLRELIAAIRGMDCGVELFTNGTLLDDDLAEFLYEQQVAVVVKRNSDRPAVQDYLAGVPGTYDRVVEGWDCLFRAGYPGEAGLGVQTVICNQNLDEIPELWRWARRRGIHPYFETVTQQGRSLDFPSLEISREQAAQVFDLLSRIDRQEFGRCWIPKPPLAGAVCDRHRYSVLVKANGQVWPCVGVSIPVGDIRQDRLEDLIRESKVIQDLRHAHQRVRGACGSCEHVEG
ncbi:MAG: radical SAM/SPASM domain-containing protein, partial [bacterium]